jgi:hypothetical protein
MALSVTQIGYLRLLEWRKLNRVYVVRNCHYINWDTTLTCAWGQRWANLTGKHSSHLKNSRRQKGEMKQGTYATRTHSSRHSGLTLCICAPLSEGPDVNYEKTSDSQSTSMPRTPACAVVALPLPPRYFVSRKLFRGHIGIFPLPIYEKQLYVYVTCDFFYLKLGVQKWLFWEYKMSYTCGVFSDTFTSLLE